MPIILLIRHGENSFVGKRLAGRLPGVHLNENGRKQAEAIAEALKEGPITAIYSSPMERACETAEPLAQALGLPIQIQEGLTEVDFGKWQGRTLKQLSKYKSWKMVQEKPSEFRFPEGDTFAEAQQRVVECLEVLKAASDEKSLIACFSHSDTIRLAVTHYLDMPLDAFQRVHIDTASITALALGDGVPRLLNVNQVLGFRLHPPKEEKSNGRKGKKKGEEVKKA
jgi:probable phosphoglycerate mutase